MVICIKIINTVISNLCPLTKKTTHAGILLINNRSRPLDLFYKINHGNIFWINGEGCCIWCQHGEPKEHERANQMRPIVAFFRKFNIDFSAAEFFFGEFQ